MGVYETMAPKFSLMSCHRRDWNVFPLSETMDKGSPKWATQPSKKAAQTLAAVASGIGRAVRYLVVLSTTVSKYRCPNDGTSGPTTSIWRSENRSGKTGLGSMGGTMVFLVFTLLHGTQLRTK